MKKQAWCFAVEAFIAEALAKAIRDRFDTPTFVSSKNNFITTNEELTELQRLRMDLFAQGYVARANE